MSGHTHGPWESFHAGKENVFSHEWSLQNGRSAFLLFDFHPEISRAEQEANAA